MCSTLGANFICIAEPTVLMLIYTSVYRIMCVAKIKLYRPVFYS